MTEQEKFNTIYTLNQRIFDTPEFSKNNMYYSDLFDFYNRYLKLVPIITPEPSTEPILISIQLAEEFQYYINARNNFMYDIYNSTIDDADKYKLLLGIAVYDDKERNKNLDETAYIYYILTKELPIGEAFDNWKIKLILKYTKERLIENDNTFTFVSLPQCYRIPKIKV